MTADGYLDFAAVHADDELLDGLQRIPFVVLWAALVGDPCATRTLAALLAAWRDDCDENLPDRGATVRSGGDMSIPAVGDKVIYQGSITLLHGDTYEVAAHEPPSCECHDVALRLIDPGYEDVRGGTLLRVRPESVRPLQGGRA